MAFPKRKSSTITLPLYSQPPPTRSLRTNLLLALLSIALTTSLLTNIFHLSSVPAKPCPFDESTIAHESFVDGHRHIPADPMPPPPLQGLEDLIVVAGHAIFVGDEPERVGEDAWWVLEDFQKGGQIEAFVDHIRKGVELAVVNEKALLVFSGGQTRQLAGSRSEAQSYWELAHDLSLVPPSPPTNTSGLAYSASVRAPFPRATTEEYARDSFENLLFSVCRFNELTGRYPHSITVVGFEFKRKRFVELHRAALRFPEESFTYIGIDPKHGALKAIDGEAINSLGPFQDDLYGCHGKLREKKLQRNPFRRSHGYRTSCPAIAPLIGFCPLDRMQVFPDSLPWDWV